MRTPLTVAAAQPSCLPYDVAANAHAHAGVIRSAAARVVVFPEMSLTGYELDAPPVSADDERLAPVVGACAETGTLALVGAPVAGAGDAVHIGVLAVDGTGARVAYRKMFLGGAEPRHMTPGEAPASVEVDGWRLGLAVCKDTGVAEHAKLTAALGVGGYLAGVLETVEDGDVVHERARRVARAHRLWVVVASFAGAAGGGFAHAAGRSGVWRPDGTAVTVAGARIGGIARATLG